MKRALVFAVFIACGGAKAKPAEVTTTNAETGIASLNFGGSAGSKKAERRTNDRWSACHSGFKPTNDLAADVVKLAQGCAALTQMHAVGEIMKGSQKAAGNPQVFPLHVDAGHCYRIYAESTEGIKDLDMLIKDSTGAIAGEDSTDDRDPVLLEDGAICFSETDEATIVMSVGAGEGSYALQTWRD